MMRKWKKEPVGIRPLERGNDQQLLAEALRTAARADVIVAAVVNVRK